MNRRSVCDCAFCVPCFSFPIKGSIPLTQHITADTVVYPNHPGKILAAPPAQKGKLTDDDVMARYIAGTATAKSFENLPTALEEAEHWMPKPEAHLPLGDVTAEANPTPQDQPVLFFFGTQGAAWNFYPMMQQTQRLTNGYPQNTHDEQSAVGAAKLRSTLLAISKRIEKREATTTDAPKYLLLDPNFLPFYLYI